MIVCVGGKGCVLVCVFVCVCAQSTFSWISWVDWASQKATVATSFSTGISTVQSRPSRRATRGRGCIGPFMMGGRMPGQTQHTHKHNGDCLILVPKVSAVILDTLIYFVSFPTLYVTYNLFFINQKAHKAMFCSSKILAGF